MVGFPFCFGGRAGLCAVLGRVSVQVLVDLRCRFWVDLHKIFRSEFYQQQGFNHKQDKKYMWKGSGKEIYKNPIYYVEAQRSSNLRIERAMS